MGLLSRSSGSPLRELGEHPEGSRRSSRPSFGVEIAVPNGISKFPEPCRHLNPVFFHRWKNHFGGKNHPASSASRRLIPRNQIINSRDTVLVFYHRWKKIKTVEKNHPASCPQREPCLRRTSHRQVHSVTRFLTKFHKKRQVL